MKRIKLLLVLLAALLLFIGCSQQKESTQWYRGNLHTHSYWSDGDTYPEMVMDWYKSHGYEFVALSDHNILAEGEKWKTIKDEEIYQQAFKNYLQKYGKDWVVYKNEDDKISVKLKTLAEYAPLFEEPGKFLIVKSEEITDKVGKKDVHLNAHNLQTLIEPQGGETIVEALQRNIDAVIQQRKETGIPMLVHINHPNFRYSVTADDMIQLHGERFFEVFNGHPWVRNAGDSLHMSTEEMWDLVNIAYANRNQPLMFGVATDDAHEYHEFGKMMSNAGRGWVQVRASSLDAESLIAAMEKGDFYASTGVALNDVSFENNTITIDVQTEPDVNYNIAFIGCKVGDDATQVLETIKGSHAEFLVTEDLQFVRAKVISDKLHDNPPPGPDYQVAWTQPVVYQK